MFRPQSVSRATLALGFTALLATAVAPTAQGASQRGDRNDFAPYTKSGGEAFAQQLARSSFSAEQPSKDPQNLPAKRENVELVSKFSPTSGPRGNIAPGQIADVAVLKDTAYLMSWQEPFTPDDDEEDCRRGGIFPVDITDPAAPKDLGFIPALPGSYHGEGAQALSVNSVGFKGDLLIVNNEPCPDAPIDEETGDTLAAGGFDLYDVTDPRNIRPLVQGFGDTGPDANQDDPESEPGSLTGDAPFANTSHSSSIWEDDGRIYAISTDYVAEFNDTDIYDVTDPRNPRPVGEYDLVRLAREQGYSPETDGILDTNGDGTSANGDESFLHDHVVKEINGRQTLLASYWDSGYVKVDIEDPANPRIIGDSQFEGADPLTGAPTEEGNGHQAEFSGDNRYFLGADEDFSPYRTGTFEITSGPTAGEYPSQEVGGGASPASLPDRSFNGPTVYVGYACDASDPVPSRESVGLRPLQSGEEAIAVVQRGPTDDPANPEAPCFPGEKAANAIEAGYDAVLFTNRHQGSAEADDVNCGSGGYPAGSAIVSVCVDHTTLHRLFNSPPKYELPVNQAGEPQIGDLGADVESTSIFDGWGYTHLYENNDGKIRRVDDYAIQESLDPRFAFGFGDLSVHEFATDPTTNLAYSAYYAGGLRVLSFGEDGLTERGAYIDDRGNNFWGVEQFTDKAGNRLIAASDRDFGLYILRYTGPGAVNAPAPGAGGGGGTTTPAPSPPSTPAAPSGPGAVPGLSGSGVRLSRTGRVGVRVSCPRTARSFCRGTLRVRAGSRSLGSRRFLLDPGETSTVRTTVPGSTRRAFRRRTRVRVSLTAVARDADNRGGTATRRVTLSKRRGR